MTQLLNTLYVTTPDAALHLDHDTVQVKIDGTTRTRLPLLHLGAIVCFGPIFISPALIARCADDGCTVVLLSRSGRFQARLEGPMTGNVLLRRAQHDALSDCQRACEIARSCIAGKVQNARFVLSRSARDANDAAISGVLSAAATNLGSLLGPIERAASIDALRGHEGDAARQYYGVFDWMVRVDQTAFHLNGRTRRPPRDRMNALLSFLYTLLTSDCRAAAETVGLDPQIGFLHVLRPGRPALALDLVEELRPVIADRLALTLVNRRQLKPEDFIERPGGAVMLSDQGRKTVLTAYQERKRQEVTHRFLDQKISVGLIPHVQARLLARHLRGDLDHYPPYLPR